MKNIHKINENIYISSDEEIKEGDWFLEKAGRQYPIRYNDKEKLNFHCKKIILTTDQSLDGVQSIDDDFLQWFVENPSCEYVEIEIKPMFPMYSTFIESIDNPPFYGNLKREIIIPKETLKNK